MRGTCVFAHVLGGEMPDRKPRTALQKRVLEDQVKLAYKQGIRAAIGSGGTSLLMAFGLWGAVPATHLLIWFGFAFALVIFRVSLYLAFWKFYPKNPARLIFWRNMTYLSIAGYGVVWAAPSIFFFPHQSLPHQMILSFMVVGLAAGASVTYGTLRGSPELYYVPAMLPLIIQFYLSDQELGWLIAGALVLYGLVMASISNHIHHTVRRTMELNRRNEELLGELQLSEEKFRGLVENATDSIVLIQNDHIEYANKATEFLSGYTQSELSKLPITAFMADSEKSRGRLYTAYQQRISGEKAPSQYEAQIKRKGGEMLDVLVSSAVVNFPEGPGVIAMIKDITELKKVERMKGELIAVVSHEMRTPITAIQSSLEAISPELEKALSPEVREIYASAQKNANKLALLVNDIRDFDKLESARMGYRMKRQSVTDLVKQAVETNRPLAESQGITLNHLSNEDPLEAWFDFNRIAQVMDNLLSNAMRFATPEAPITLEAVRSGGWARVSVSNRGPGIPMDFRERIFLPFSQADPESEHSGSGLGLSICKTIIEDHNGLIGFESEPGGTTTFYFLLPEEKMPA